MKIKKISLSILSFIAICIFNPTRVNAFLPRVVYNPVNVFISNVMRIAPRILIIAYIIGASIYYKKSRKETKHKIIKIVIWLIIMIVTATTLYCCADAVLETGATYTSRPNNLFK